MKLFLPWHRCVRFAMTRPARDLRRPLNASSHAFHATLRRSIKPTRGAPSSEVFGNCQDVGQEVSHGAEQRTLQSLEHMHASRGLPSVAPDGWTCAHENAIQPTVRWMGVCPRGGNNLMQLDKRDE